MEHGHVVFREQFFNSAFHIMEQESFPDVGARMPNVITGSGSLCRSSAKRSSFITNVLTSLMGTAAQMWIHAQHEFLYALPRVVEVVKSGDFLPIPPAATQPEQIFRSDFLFEAGLGS